MMHPIHHCEKRIAIKITGRKPMSGCPDSAMARTPAPVSGSHCTRLADLTLGAAFCLSCEQNAAPYRRVRQRKGSARFINSSRPGSAGLRGLPGWMIETWQFSAASTSSA